MTITTQRSLIFSLILVFAVACKPTVDKPVPATGNLNASRFVAIGNSLTAGFTDGALYYNGQKNSFANILAEQFKAIGGGDFVQPYTNMSSVGMGTSMNAKLILGYKSDCKGVTALGPMSAAASGDMGVFTSVANPGPYNNMGIPGAKAITAIYPGYGNPANGPGAYNPFFTRMLIPSEYATASMLSKAASQSPTFFSMFIGNNDVLGYALAGGAADAITPSAGVPGVGFDASIDLIISTLMANGAKGVVGNIPDVTSIPYFTTVPYNGLTLNATQAAQLSAAYAPLGITFSEGANAFIIKDAAAPGGMRKIKSTELVLLSTPQDSLKCAGWGSQKPISTQYILNETEIGNLRSAVAAYNSKLKSVADSKGLAFVDVNGFLANFLKGIAYNGMNITTTYVSGGAFSLDGIHLTPRGNALLANEFIKSINKTYGATIAEVDVTKYNGVIFP